jgi:hypothetical protein
MGGANAQYEATAISPSVAKFIGPSAGGSYQFRALSPVSAMSSNPEAIAQGLAKGAQGLASGIFSGHNQSQKSPQAKQQMDLGYRSPIEATPFVQNHPTSIFSPAMNFDTVKNVGSGMNFMVNPFLQR